jgi:pimeloyl-ACP methyl ester carboxylesterase
MVLNVILHPPTGSETAAPLVIAHGLFGSARNFNTLGRKLATDRRVVLIDMRNHGESPWSDDVSYEAMADDLAEAVDRHCQGRAVVLGHSMGGKAAMALALSHPDMLSGVIVADIAPVDYPHTHLPLVQAMRGVDLGAVARRSDAEPKLAGAADSPMLRAFLLQNLVIEDGKARWRINLPALEEGMPGLTAWPEDLDARQYPGPSLFIYGGVSSYMGPEREARIRPLFPSVEFLEIPGADHWLHAEKPAEFLAAVEGWLGTL